MTKAEHDITTPTRRAALSGSGAALAGTALAVLGGRAVAAAGAAGTGASLSAGADPVLALWRQYVELDRQQDQASKPTDALRAALVVEA